MPDVQILATGTQDAPLDYTLAPGAEIVPKCVRALFDGTGAAGSFLPTLTLISNSGHEVFSIPVSSAVAAGASAKVSWFPGGDLDTGGSTAAALPWAYADGDITTDGFAGPAIFSFVTSDPSIYTLNGPSDGILLNETGTYLALFRMDAQDNTIPQEREGEIAPALDNNASISDSNLVYGPWIVQGAGPSVAGGFIRWLPSGIVLATVNQITNPANPPRLSTSALIDWPAAITADLTITVVRIGPPLGTIL